MKRFLSVIGSLSLVCAGYACIDTGGAGGTTVGAAATSTTSTSGGGTTTSMGGAGTTGGMGGMATGPGGGGAGMGGADTCPDDGVGEPNETMATAAALADGTDCSELSTSGVIDGPGDVDWYSYSSTDDEFGCEVFPARAWSQTAGHTIRVCKYVECADGSMTDQVQCEDGSTDDTEGGLLGCCGTEPFKVDVAFLASACSGDDHLNIYTRVDEPDAPADTCTVYNLNYDL